MVRALKKFSDIVYGYRITIFTDHAPVTHLFTSKNLHGRLARWFLTIEEFCPEIKHVPGKANVVADSLSRNIAVVVNNPPPLENFSLPELATAQRDHGLWRHVIYALESGDESTLPHLPVPFSQFFLSPDRVLCRNWPGKRSSVDQLVIPDTLVPAVLRMVHDAVIAGHPGKERTLTAARARYFWPTMRLDIDEHVAKCVKCAQYKGTSSGPAPILEYPPPTRPWDVVSIDLLQLPQSTQGSKYVLVMVDMFSRYVVLAPIKDKTAQNVAHALVTRLICEYSAPRVLLSDNGAEFRNRLLHEICNQFGINHTFTVAYHPASNGLVERTNRKILEVLRPVVGTLLHTWEDWLPHVAASINSSVCESTGQSPHFIVFGVEKRLPYDLLGSSQPPVYDFEDYAKIQLKVFADVHTQVRNRLLQTSAARSSKQHKRAAPVNFKVGDSVMVQTPERHSKLEPKFEGPFQIIRDLGGNKFQIGDRDKGVESVVHSDRLKLTAAEAPACAVPADMPSTDPHSSTVSDVSPPPQIQHTYNLRPRS